MIENSGQRSVKLGAYDIGWSSPFDYDVVYMPSMHLQFIRPNWERLTIIFIGTSFTDFVLARYRNTWELATNIGLVSAVCRLSMTKPVFLHHKMVYVWITYMNMNKYSKMYWK